MALNLQDVIFDTMLGIPIEHIIQEFLLTVLAGVLAIYLIFDMHKRTRKYLEITTNLKVTKHQLAKMSDQFRNARHQFSLAIAEQFEQWMLSESEKEIAIFMLKGLSLKEIAVLRDTKEKTVRQQASAIYAKAGIEGRHALSAWFFEDLLGESEQPSTLS